MKILFMCVANSARSQLAEGLARVVFPEAEIQSAGSRPGKINPFAIQVMREIGIDISTSFSKDCDRLDPEFIMNLDYIITLCYEEVCPIVVSNAKRVHWPFPDPAINEASSNDESLKRFRRVRDGILEKLNEFKEYV